MKNLAQILTEMLHEMAKAEGWDIPSNIKVKLVREIDFDFNWNDYHLESLDQIKKNFNI